MRPCFPVRFGRGSEDAMKRRESWRRQTVAVAFFGFLAVNSQAQSSSEAGDPRLAGLSDGVSAIHEAVAGGDFGMAMDGLAGAFDNGAAGFPGAGMPVAGGESSGRPMLRPALSEAGRRAFHDVPPPGTRPASTSSEGSSGWPLAGAAGAVILALLRESNDEGASDLKRNKTNPKNDPDVAKGIEKQKEYYNQRQFNEHVENYKPGEDGKYDVKPAGGNATGGGAR